MKLLKHSISNIIDLSLETYCFINSQLLDMPGEISDEIVNVNFLYGLRTFIKRQRFPFDNDTKQILTNVMLTEIFFIRGSIELVQEIIEKSL
jgi:hypothetical protein